MFHSMHDALFPPPIELVVNMGEYPTVYSEIA